MTKAESIAYLKKLKALDEAMLPGADGVIPPTKRDVTDELGHMEPFREFEKDKENQNSV